MRKLLLLIVAIYLWPVSSYALVDVSGKVELIRGAPVYELETNKTFIEVTLHNFSPENIELPIRLTVSHVQDNNVALDQPDGYDLQGNPYYLLSFADKIYLEPGEQLGPRRIYFNNIVLGKCISTRIKSNCSGLVGKNRENCIGNEKAYCFATFNPIQGGYGFNWVAEISTVQDTLDAFVSALELGDMPSIVIQFDEKAAEKYMPVLGEISDQLLLLAQDLRSGTFVRITDVMAKYEVTVLEDDGETIYDIYLYKNSSGEWKIFMM